MNDLRIQNINDLKGILPLSYVSRNCKKVDWEGSLFDNKLEINHFLTVNNNNNDIFDIIGDYSKELYDILTQYNIILLSCTFYIYTDSSHTEKELIKAFNDLLLEKYRCGHSIEVYLCASNDRYFYLDSFIDERVDEDTYVEFEIKIGIWDNDYVAEKLTTFSFDIFPDVECRGYPPNNYLQLYEKGEKIINQLKQFREVRK